MKSLLPFVTFLLFVSTAQSQYAQKTVLYEGRGQGGQYLTIPQSYVADLKHHNFDNRAQSVCTTGLWLYYSNPNFNRGDLGGVEYVFGPNNYCNNLLSLGGHVSSVRYVGASNDYRLDAFTLYEEDWYQGDEEYLLGDTANLNLAGRHKSIIINGRSPWTVFDHPGFTGNSICLYPSPSPNYQPYLIPDVYNQGIPHNTIRSVRKGCTGSSSEKVSSPKLGVVEVQQGNNVVASAAQFGKQTGSELH